MSDSKDPIFKVRRWKKKDIPALVACHRDCYPDYPADSHYDERLHRLQLEAFPEGQFLVEVEGQVVGYATSLIVQIDDDSERYTYNELTGGSTFSTHNPAGDTLYGADIAVSPKWRGRRLAEKLYKRRRRLVRQLNLRRMVAFGRIPGYGMHAGRMTPEEYVKKVKIGELKDPALNAHLKAGYSVKKVLLDYMPDQSSLGHATLLEWLNPKYDAAKRQIMVAPMRRVARRVRVCASQFLMRRISTWEEFEQTVDFFVDTASAYHCHFLLMPEYFTAQMTYTMGDNMSFDNAVVELAQYTDKYIEMMEKFATNYQIYIVGGTTPVSRDGKLYNTAHLFTPSGMVYTQDKLHITPTERDEWGVVPGEKIRVFETPFGKIAIQICYDIEFPELSRLLALAGVEIIFVPFSTDEKKAFNRVHFTARARAVENYLYVVTSGNVGNLPMVKNYLINYGQSGIFTPSDFAFPVDAIAGLADPNVETVVTADLDLEVLALQREMGSVRPFFDRRPDLYSLTATEAIEFIRVT